MPQGSGIQTQFGSGAGSCCWWNRSIPGRGRGPGRRRTMRPASSTNTGILQRGAQEIHRSRACLPSPPLTENTWRRTSLSRYARCKRGRSSGRHGWQLRHRSAHQRKSPERRRDYRTIGARQPSRRRQVPAPKGTPGRFDHPGSTAPPPKNPGIHGTVASVAGNTITGQHHRPRPRRITARSG